MSERSKARKGDRWRRRRKAAFREDGSFALIRRGEERRGEGFRRRKQSRVEKETYPRG